MKAQPLTQVMPPPIPPAQILNQPIRRPREKAAGEHEPARQHRQNEK